MKPNEAIEVILAANTAHTKKLIPSLDKMRSAAILLLCAAASGRRGGCCGCSSGLLSAAAAGSQVLVPPLIVLQKDQFEVDIECRAVAELDDDKGGLEIFWQLSQVGGEKVEDEEEFLLWGEIGEKKNLPLLPLTKRNCPFI